MCAALSSLVTDVGQTKIAVQLMARLPSWLMPWSEAQETKSKHSIADPSLVQTPESSASTSSLPAALPVAVPDAATAAAADEGPRFTEEDERFYRNGPSLAIPMTGASLGFVSGFHSAAKRSGLVFMAENTHRRPTTVQGWYFYNKTKNYKVLLAGAQGGVKSALHVALWTSGYVVVENAVQAQRQRWIEEADGELSSNPASSLSPFVQNTLKHGRWFDGAVAGVTVASVGSVLYRLPRPMTRRLLVLGLVAGASVGGLRQVQSQLIDVQSDAMQSSSDASSA